jgi:hypothetical protein
MNKRPIKLPTTVYLEVDFIDEIQEEADKIDRSRTKFSETLIKLKFETYRSNKRPTEDVLSELTFT